MKTLVVLASALGITLSIPTFSADPENTQEKAKSKPDDLVIDVMRDRYFRSEQCENYLSDLTMLERDLLVKSNPMLAIEDTLTYVEGGDSVTGRLERQFESQGHAINPDLVAAREKLKNSPALLKFYSDDVYQKDKSRAALKAYLTIINNKKKGSEQRKNVTRYMYCRTAAISSGIGVYANHFEKYVTFVQSRVKKAQVGYFEVTADKGTYGPKVGTGNQFAEPKSWEGSRFFVVHASFKNIDTESRLPIEGSLFINYNEKEYEFDSIESISLQGYNIWFRKINPLVTMKTKIVYRIPNEIRGEVFWKPGRNANDVRLWLGFIEQEK